MTSLVVAFGVTLLVFLLVMVGMAVGVLMGRRQLSGSCGGLANQTDSEGETACSLCSNADAACKELGRRMQGQPAGTGTAPGLDEQVVPDCDQDCLAAGCAKEQIDACKRG